MSISVFDLFKIGIGPSSSHTVGPMRAAFTFVSGLRTSEKLGRVSRIKSELYGSLATTGRGHGSPKAILMGLMGEVPEQVEVESIDSRVAAVISERELCLPGAKTLAFNMDQDLILHMKEALPFHPNGMKFSAFDREQNLLDSKIYYSVGGGFVVDETASKEDPLIEVSADLPYAFSSGDKLLRLCSATGLSISALMMENEKVWRSEAQIKDSLLAIWEAMRQSVDRGLKTQGRLPGGLRVKRRAPQLYQLLMNQQAQGGDQDPLNTLDWVTLYALAVNEENAAGGRVVTAPTNGAAGIIPAVLQYCLNFCQPVVEDAIVRFFLTAAAIGILYKENASISGAEVGCQGEVGSACSMAAGALTELMGGTPEQVENAAEIAMEHNLGLTCDPIGGLVQVPCIERNAMAAIKAISASRMALRGDGTHLVSLDNVIKTMRDTGRDMHNKYKETARGGLAINVVEVPVNIVEC